MDNPAIELSWRNDEAKAGNVVYDGNANSTKTKHVDGQVNEDFGPSYSLLDDMKRMYQRRIVVISLITLVIGACLGAAVAVIIFTQTDITDIPSTNSSYAPLNDRKTTEIPSPSSPAPTTQIPSTALPSPSYDKVKCPAIYNGRCYRAILGEDVNRTDAEKLCNEIGWDLANIYSTSHFYMVEGYLRTLFDDKGYISAWTGMSMIPENLQLVLSTGENVTLPGIPWHKGYPDSDPINVDIGVDFLKTPNAGAVDTQGMWNYDPWWDGNAALCERP